jgi:hypothetical protein
MNQFSNHPLYRRHNIDSALSSLWDFYKKKFIALFLLSLGMSVAIQYASSMVNINEISEITDPELLLEKMKGYLLPILIVTLISLLATTILHYYIIFNPIDNESTVLTALVRSLKYYIPYLIIMVLFGFAAVIAVVLGIFVLIIGAFFAMIYAATIYFFILPVMMAEEVNIGTTISRTIKLAHRNFWSNIGWVSVFIIIMLVVSLVLSSIILLPFTGSFFRSIVDPEQASALVEVTKKPLYIALSALVSALTLPLMPIFACILYFNGRSGEEQPVTPVSDYSPTDGKVRVEDLYAKPFSEDHPENPDNKN